ncbi:MAG: DUF4276 family protein [Paracoccaceae bacterium]|nr:DUF4276 family protein [Paracoccaceae bacterium]MDE2916929.1 DUF4276 family protein [Paracoccaceae bacterium]
MAVSVEGQTEEEFVKEILAPHLRQYNVCAIPILLGRAIGWHQGGGNVNIDRLVRDMKHLAHSFDYITSLVDFYGFKEKCQLGVDQLEARIHDRIQENYPKRGNVFIPYVQLHEFEGLLFSDVEQFIRQLIDLYGTSQSKANELRKIVNEFPNPEDINDNSNTAPSKRIERIEPEYHKVIDGPLIAEMIGLNIIRDKCPRFNYWVTKLESLQD